MNHMFQEERSKEKISDLLDEGVRSQEYYRNRSRRTNPLLLFGRGIAAVLGFIAHQFFSRGKHPANSHHR
jgi:hypothetical protein